MCSTCKSISYRMTVTYFYKLTLQQYLFTHVQPVKLNSMERIVNINVLILHMVVTANLNVTVVSQNVTMLMAVNTLSWVCTSTFLIKYNIKFDINQMFIGFLIIVLHFLLYIYKAEQIDNKLVYKSEFSVTDHPIHSTLHLNFNTVAEERIGKVYYQIKLINFSLNFYTFHFNRLTICPFV